MIYISSYKGPQRVLQEKIAIGPKAVVFRLSDDYAVKFKMEGWPFRKISNESSVHYALGSEYRVLKELHTRGISVPKPLGVFKVSIQNLPSFRPPYNFTFFRSQSFPGLVMEHIDGIFIENAPKEKRKELTDRALEEVSKAIIGGLSFIHEGYDASKNALWVPETDKIYLTGLDFLISNIFRK